MKPMLLRLEMLLIAVLTAIAIGQGLWSLGKAVAGWFN